MKSLVSLLFITSLALTVSCGDDKKSKSSSQNLSSNPYQASTFTAYYNPGALRQNQVYYGGRWYTLSPMSQQAYSDLQQLYQQTAQDYSQGSGQYSLTVVGNVAVYRVQVVGSVGGVNTQQYPQQQYPQQNSSGTITVQSIKRY